MQQVNSPHLPGTGFALRVPPTSQLQHSLLSYTAQVLYPAPLVGWGWEVLSSVAEAVTQLLA